MGDATMVFATKKTPFLELPVQTSSSRKSFSGRQRRMASIGFVALSCLALTCIMLHRHEDVEEIHVIEKNLLDHTSIDGHLFDIFGGACSTYRKATNGECAQACLQSTVGVCPIDIVIKFGGLEKGDCKDVGYTESDGSTTQKAGPCGDIKFDKYKKSASHEDGTDYVILPQPSATRPVDDQDILEGAILPVWTYSDDSGCLETRYNVAALWITEKGTGIDTGHSSGKVKEGKTCAEQGFTVARPHEFDDLPKFIRAIYNGV